MSFLDKLKKLSETNEFKELEKDFKKFGENNFKFELFNVFFADIQDEANQKNGEVPKSVFMDKLLSMGIALPIIQTLVDNNFNNLESLVAYKNLNDLDKIILCLIPTKDITDEDELNQKIQINKEYIELYVNGVEMPSAQIYEKLGMLFDNFFEFLMENKEAVKDLKWVYHVNVQKELLESNEIKYCIKNNIKLNNIFNNELLRVLDVNEIKHVINIYVMLGDGEASFNEMIKALNKKHKEHKNYAKTSIYQKNKVVNDVSDIFKKASETLKKENVDNVKQNILNQIQGINVIDGVKDMFKVISKNSHEMNSSSNENTQNVDVLNLINLTGLYFSTLNGILNQNEIKEKIQDESQKDDILKTVNEFFKLINIDFNNVKQEDKLIDDILKENNINSETTKKEEYDDYISNNLYQKALFDIYSKLTAPEAKNYELIQNVIHLMLKEILKNKEFSPVKFKMYLDYIEFSNNHKGLIDKVFSDIAKTLK